MVERVDVDVTGLAGVAGARLQKPPGERAGGVRHQLQTLGLVVDALGGAGRRQGGDCAVIGQHLVAPLGTAFLLDTLEDSRGRPPDCHGVRVLGRQLVRLGQHPQAELQVSRQYSGWLSTGLPCAASSARSIRPRHRRLVPIGGHPENCTRGGRPPFTSPWVQPYLRGF